jgi:ABC-type Fe3+/spermidine/putrescine transport system ATPase subunit
MKTIDIVKISKSFKGRPAVIDFSLEVHRAQRIVILGPSGCGKSTVLRLVAGFAPPDSGRISIDGEMVSADGRVIKPPEERRLGMVFQDLALWPHMSVRGNLEFGLKAKGVPKAERDERVGETLNLVQMREYAELRPGRLSGGQQQRIALERALVLRPQILLLDEPLSSLDMELNRMLRKEIIRIQERLGLTLLHVTHNREEAFAIGTWVVVMKSGGVHLSGPPQEVRAHFGE